VWCSLTSIDSRRFFFSPGLAHNPRILFQVVGCCERVVNLFPNTKVHLNRAVEL